MSSVGTQKTRRLLIIDDNPAIHNDIRNILIDEDQSTDFNEAASALFGESTASQPSENYEIDSAHQGQEGYEKVIQAVDSNRPYACAFVDMRMPPGWDGLETIAHLWQKDPDLEIVICTAYSDYSWSDIVGRLGQTDQLLILKKPFDASEVRQLASCLTRKRYLAEQARIENRRLEGIVDERTAELQEKNRALEATLQELKQTQAMMLHAEKLSSIGQLASGIAHEINTPIQYVGDNTQFLEDAFSGINALLERCEKLLAMAKEGRVDDQLVKEIVELQQQTDIEYLVKEIPKAIEQSRDGVHRVTAIVKAMKNFSHPGTEEKTTIDLRESIETTITVARNAWKYVANIQREFDPHLPSVRCYPGELNQVLLNLIVNAAHTIGDVLGSHPTERGTITVGTRRDGGWVEMFIRDTGTGIPEEIRAKIFDPFFTTKEIGKGTGQGLAIARSVILDKHEGTIECQSEVGKGTTFVIRLPINGERGTVEPVELQETTVSV